jgi:hypothetical protein
MPRRNRSGRVDQAAVPASNGRMRITPLSCLPLPPEHGRSLEPPLSLPGGSAPALGHGGLAFTALGGFGLALGFGFGVDATGLGVGAGLTRGVGAGVTRGVGAGVSRGVARGVGAAVASGVGAGVTLGGPVGSCTGGTTATAVGLATDPDGDTDGLAEATGDGLAGGDAPGDGPTEGCPPGGVVWPAGSGVSAGSTDCVGVGVGMTAMTSVGRAEDAACCCSSTPPMPRAIVASTRFRIPRLRMSRTR